MQLNTAERLEARDNKAANLAQKNPIITTKYKKPGFEGRERLDSAMGPPADRYIFSACLPCGRG